MNDFVSDDRIMKFIATIRDNHNIESICEDYEWTARETVVAIVKSTFANVTRQRIEMLVDTAERLGTI